MTDPSMKIIDFGIDWRTMCFFSPELSDPDKRSMIKNSLVAYVDPTLKSGKKGALQNDFRYAQVYGSFLLWQERGWGFAKFGHDWLLHSHLTRAKILKCFSANRIELTNFGDSRLDFQVTVASCFSPDEMQNWAQLDGGSGNYREFYKMKKGLKQFGGWDLIQENSYKARFYNKTLEASKDEKKELWLTEKMQGQPPQAKAWRLEIQLEKGLGAYENIIDPMGVDLFEIKDGDSDYSYREIVETGFKKFNSRIQMSVIHKMLNLEVAGTSAGVALAQAGLIESSNSSYPFCKGVL